MDCLKPPQHIYSHVDKALLIIDITSAFKSIYVILEVDTLRYFEKVHGNVGACICHSKVPVGKFNIGRLKWRLKMLNCH